MKTTSTVTLAALALGAVATPMKRATPLPAGIDDTVILNYALTLEHLENAFYSEALAKFDEKAFTDAGLPSTARARFAQVGAHEEAHVKFLSAALGSNATVPCKYNFPYTDVVSFAALAQALEGVGVSAYTGAARYITNGDYLTAAASVLSTEARHASWVAAAINKQAPWSGGLDVPLGLNQVYTLAAQFIASCPDDAAKLPVNAFPSFTIDATATPGNAAEVKYDTSKIDASSAALYVAFYTGLSQVFAEVKDGKATIPKDLVGTVYAVLSWNGTVVTDASTVAGVAILNFPDEVTAAASAAPASGSSSPKSASSMSGAVSLRSGSIVAALSMIAGLVLAI